MKQGEWKQHDDALKKQINGEYYCHPFIDSRGLLWVNDQFWDDPSTTVVDIRHEGTATQVKRLGNRMTNQNNVEMMAYYRQCLAEGSMHNVWIGTNGGPGLVEASRCSDASAWVTQPVVGEGIVGQPTYLMQGQPIFAIEVDADGRLWIASNGLYLIDSDGVTQLEHFTAENSPLLSNNINDLEYNPKTGMIYIATENGLCAYQTGVSNDETTGGIHLSHFTSQHSTLNCYYTLSGQKLPGKPSQPGIYIHKGRKVVLK